MSQLLKIENLSKTFHLRGFKDMLRGNSPTVVRALSSISLEIQPGQITALLGPNGAGKTTMINILCDLTRADTGKLQIAGHAIPEHSQKAQRQVGYVTTNDRSFFWRLSGRKNLEFFAALHGFSRPDARERTAEMLERFNLSAHADKPFYIYSAGMKKRLGLARAFLHDPAVLLMDEPTNGLDAKSTDELIDLVRDEIQSSQKTILWATHRTEEVERLCDWVIVLIGGKIYFDDTIDRFRAISRRHQEFTIELRLQPEQRKKFDQIVNSDGLVVRDEKTNGLIEVDGKGDEQYLSELLQKLLESGALIRQIERRPESLHEVFTHLQDIGGNS